jgi:hypothetical protein
VQPLVTALEATISSLVKGTAVDEAALFGSVAELIAENQTIAFGPASVGVSGGLVSPAVGFGPVTPEAMAAQNLDYSIGKVKLAASLDLTANEPFQGFTISILDLRLGTGGSTTGTCRASRSRSGSRRPARRSSRAAARSPSSRRSVRSTLSR